MLKCDFLKSLELKAFSGLHPQIYVFQQALYSSRLIFLPLVNLLLAWLKIMELKMPLGTDKFD